MFGWLSTKGVRRKVKEPLSKNGSAVGSWLRPRLFSWASLLGFAFVAGAVGVTFLGDEKIDYVVNQRIEQPIYAKVGFQLQDNARTESDRRAARAKTPSRYGSNSPALTFERIRSDLMRLYRIAVDADSFEAFEASMKEHGWPVDRNAYTRLRALVDLPDEAGRKQFQEWVDALPLEKQFVVQKLSDERRDPPSLADYILLLETRDDKGEVVATKILHSELDSRESENAIQGIASRISRRFPSFELRPNVEAIVVRTFREQPTLVFDQAATLTAMQAAEQATPVALTTYEANKPFISPGILTAEEYDLLKAHQAAYLAFLAEGGEVAAELRSERFRQRAGTITLVLLVALGLVALAGVSERQHFRDAGRAVPAVVLALATLFAARLIDIRWPQYPELLFAPTLMAASILAIVFGIRFAVVASCILAVLVTLVTQAHLPFLLTLLTGVVVAVVQLDEIRTRTKLPRIGAVTALAVMIASGAGGLAEGHVVDLVVQQALLAAVVAFGAAGMISLLLPFIERFFQTATSLTLLEWRDPTRPLLQLLAREAPGTYSHSLVLGTMAESACDRIGANALLTQVGALYHDIGKIHRPSYFAENQEGRINRHDNLAPSMSLLIILGHVKDGLELARQYKLPRILHQFIAEHHGTTVVRYFHRMASEKQAHAAGGRHDREVSEADFRYPGPRPRIRESAILMLCDGVEGAVRSLSEPTVGRIESTVEQIVSDRLNDGQFDECDITLREIRMVQESLVKSLCSIYHGRVAYPKAAKPPEATRDGTGLKSVPQRISV